MPKKCADPEWYVYVDNSNKRTIEKFNVFHSHNFLDGCKQAFKKYRKPEELNKLKDEIKSLAMYSFWSKCEYEIIITSWPPANPKLNFKDIKVDVYDQLMLNWDSFITYTIGHRAYFLRKEK